MPRTAFDSSHRPTGPVPRVWWSRHLHEPTCLATTALLALLLLGYHPSAEDGGIYAAAIQARLNPALFPHDRIWVTAHTRFALFVPLAGAITRTLHLPLATVLFSLYAAGLIGLLAASAHLARTCFPDERLPWLATLAVAIGAGLPVAGTALYAVDPYCTARTLTTPLLLFALSLALRHRWPASAACWAAAATIHPLMALWAALPLLLTAALATRHPRQSAFALAALVFAAAILLNAALPHEAPAAYAVAHTRAYWFPAQWRWYEWTGAVAPCILLASFARQLGDNGAALRHLSIVLILTTVIAAALALCFARETASSLAVARLQPMRSLHLVFVAFFAATAAVLQSRLRTTLQTVVAIAACAIAAASVFAMQRSLYSHTPHLEWPGAPLSNSWEAAFAWCRSNTPTDALFALDSGYINEPGEDSHGFRAAALRSALPDAVKDAGIAAVLPALTSSWQTAVQATQDLNTISDAQRRDRLVPLGVTWIVLPASASTALTCPFSNAAAQV